MKASAFNTAAAAVVGFDFVNLVAASFENPHHLCAFLLEGRIAVNLVFDVVVIVILAVAVTVVVITVVIALIAVVVTIIIAVIVTVITLLVAVGTIVVIVIVVRIRGGACGQCDTA